MEARDELKQQRWEIMWAVQRSQRYHSRRSAFFDRWHKVTLLAGILGGSAAIASIGKDAPTWLILIGGALVATLSAMDLVVGTGEMARKHNDLRRRFCNLEQLIQRSPVADELVLADWRSERLSIESDEPPAYVALDILVENELARSFTHLKDQPPHELSFIKGHTAHFIRWEDA